MVNNFTNINKMNNNLTPYIAESGVKHNKSIKPHTFTHDVGNSGHGLGQAQNVAGLNLLMESQPSSNWISNYKAACIIFFI